MPRRSRGKPIRITWQRVIHAQHGARLVDRVQRPLHRDGAASPPMSASYGRFSAASTRSVATTTAVTVPAIIPCTTADSPLSAKKSRYTKISAAEKNNTNHTGSGTIPSAACRRSRRASSRAAFGRATSRTRSARWRPRLDRLECPEQREAPRVDRGGTGPDPMAGHSCATTERP